MKNLYGVSGGTLLYTFVSGFNLDIINGTLTDSFVTMDSDILYLHSTGKIYKGYAIERLNTTLSNQMSKDLFVKELTGY